MLIRMRESKGFTLVELMIVVAIIGILAAVAVPFYQRYVQKSRLTSLVFPSMHSVETNIAAYFAMSGSTTLPESATTATDDIDPFIRDADTRCLSSITWSGASMKLTFTVASSTACTQLKQFAGKVITARAVTTGGASGKISTWKLGGDIAVELGLAE